MREIPRKAPVRARGSALTQMNEALALVNDVRGVGGHSRRSLDAHRGVLVDARVCTCAGVVIAKRELAETHFFWTASRKHHLDCVWPAFSLVYLFRVTSARAPKYSRDSASDASSASQSTKLLQIDAQGVGRPGGGLVENICCLRRERKRNRGPEAAWAAMLGSLLH